LSVRYGVQKADCYGLFGTKYIPVKFISISSYGKGKGKGNVFPLQARLWPRGWVQV